MANELLPMIKLRLAFYDEMQRHAREDTPRIRQGQLTGVNSDGTVMVSVEADPVGVPATIAHIPGYTPAQGHLVMVVTHQGWAHVLHAINGPNNQPTARF